MRRSPCSGRPRRSHFAGSGPGGRVRGAGLGATLSVAVFLWLGPDAVGAAGGAGEFVAPNPWIVLEGNLPELPPIDATQACFPSEVLERPPALDQARRGRLRELLETLDKEIAAGRADPWAEATRWVLVARTTGERFEQNAAFEALSSLARDVSAGRTRACFELEVARLELLRHNFPEAAAWSLRAEEGATGEAEIIENAQFLRAEALYLSGRHPQAQALYAPLEQSPRTSLSRAARLRAADLAADAGRPEAALPRYEELLPLVSSFGADGHVWAARVGEAAFQAAEYAAALAWFQRYGEQGADARGRALAEIRVADSAAILGKLPESRALLEDIAAHSRDPSVGDLASIRLAIPPIGTRKSPADLERLEAATRSSNPRVSQYARAELGRGYLEADEVYRALEVLTRLAFEGPEQRLAPWLDIHFADAIERVAVRADSEDGCREVIRVIGWRREFLLRHSGRPSPFLRLGECYEEAGLPGQAIHLYRSLVRRFGVRVGEDVSLPLARAALGAGELGVAKAAARARVEAGAGPAWALLLARVYVKEGREPEALATLRSVLEGDEARGATHAQAVWWLAILATRQNDYGGIHSLLAAADSRLANAGGLSDAQRGDIDWVRGEAARREGLVAAARRGYQRASALLPTGPRRAAAQYWLGVLEEDPERERHHYSAGLEADPGGLWATLAGEELALSRLRERYGRPEALQR